MSETFDKSQISESFDVPAGCIIVQETDLIASIFMQTPTFCDKFT